MSDVPKIQADAPLISIVVPTYLHEKYIAACLHGIVTQQTSIPFEVLVGVDCSPDDTASIVQEFACRYPNIVIPLIRETNMGPTKNCQDMIVRSRGKYMAFCEGDDEWIDPLKLQKQFEILEANPEIVLTFTDIDQYFVSSGVRVTSLQARKGQTLQYKGQDAWFEAILLRKIGIHTPTILARTECYRAARDDIADVLEWVIAGDTPTLLALTRYGEFTYTPGATAMMNRLPESMSRSQSYLKTAKFHWSSIRMSLAMAEKYGYWSKAFERLLVNRVRFLLRLCILDQASQMSDEVMAACVQDKRFRWDWTHYLLWKCTKGPLLSTIYQHIDRIGVFARRRYRKFRYGIESSV